MKVDLSPTALGKELGLDRPQKEMLDAMESSGLIRKVGQHYQATSEGKKWGGEDKEKSSGGPAGQWKTVWTRRVLSHPELRATLNLGSQ